MDLQSLVLLALLLWSHSQAEVVTSISECTEFFLDGSSPAIPTVVENGNIKDQNRYKAICQTYPNQPNQPNQPNKLNRRFFTLYDTTNKIPVFSAYIFNPKKYQRPKWRIEQELKEQDQATDNDYKNSDYTRGHLFPCSYGHTKEDKDSTFTLTNIVPQEGTFNSGSWASMEQCVKCVMEKYCKDKKGVIKAHLVTGAEPGNKKMKDSVNVPSAMWSAFCCYRETEDKWLASAYWGKNDPEQKNQLFDTLTLNELYDKFKDTEKKGFKLFTTKCPLNEKVTEYYSKPDAKCKCQGKNSPVHDSPVETPDICDENSPEDPKSWWCTIL